MKNIPQIKSRFQTDGLRFLNSEKTLVIRPLSPLYFFSPKISQRKKHPKTTAATGAKKPTGQGQSRCTL